MYAYIFAKYCQMYCQFNDMSVFFFIISKKTWIKHKIKILYFVQKRIILS